MASKALESFQNNIQHIKFYEQDVKQMKIKLNEMKFAEYHESVACDLIKGVSSDKDSVDMFLADLNKIYGIKKNILDKLRRIIYSEEVQSFVQEFHYSADATAADPNESWYGLAVLTKVDGKFDCAIALHKCNFVIAMREQQIAKTHKALWGMVSWQTTHIIKHKPNLSMDEIEKLKNFFRFKALKGFESAGWIESLEKNKVHSLAEATRANDALE